MTFRGTQSTIFALVLFSIFTVIVYQFSKPFFVILIFIILWMLVYSLTSYIIITKTKLIKKTLVFFSEEIEIKDINYIEAVTEKKVGYIYIKIGKSDPEDYYILHMKNKSKIKINAYFNNRGRSVGRYLKKEYKIELKEKDKIKYIYGNP